ncbi:unnamed protein product, partial [Gordionus sp. m RMFG-2023]
SRLSKQITYAHHSKEDHSLIEAINNCKTQIIVDSHPPTTHRQKDWDVLVVACCIETHLLSSMQLTDHTVFSSLLNGTVHEFLTIPSVNLQLDTNGRHSLHCRSCNGRFIRHRQCNSIIQHALKSAQISSILEPLGLFRSDGKQPDGIT